MYATRVRHLRYGYTDSDLQRAFLQALDDFGYDEAFIGFVMAVCIRHELHITITRERERESPSSPSFLGCLPNGPGATKFSAEHQPIRYIIKDEG
jgi:hypothetical protein